MKKEITYQVKREIEWLPVNDELNVVAFQERIYMGGKLTEEKEGLATLDQIEDRKLDTPIERFRKPLAINGENPNLPASLYRKKVREVLRRNLMGSTEGLNNIQKELISKPYTYVKANGLEDVELLFFNYGNHAVYDTNGKLLPKAIYFDYISGHVDNYYYDLEEFYKALAKRNDIDFVTERRREKEIIKEIPYYNAEPHRNKCIEFVWFPTPEDFEKIIPEFSKNSFDRFKNIIEIVFGVKQREADEDEDED